MAREAKKDKKSYTNFVVELIKKVPAGKPIYFAGITEAMAEYYSLDIKKTAAAVAVAMKRIMDKRKVEGLCLFKKGIYYVTKRTSFGEIGIDKEKMIFDKYLQNNKGYVGGLMMMYQLGLTTQLPKTKEIVTNAAKECLRNDNVLGVSIRPPKTVITGDNKEYLRILDAIELIDKAPVDAEHPYNILAKHIKDKDLRYDIMLALADKYYSKSTIYKLAHTANAGGTA